MSGVDNLTSFLLAPTSIVESAPAVSKPDQAPSGFSEALAAQVNSGGSGPAAPVAKPQPEKPQPAKPQQAATGPSPQSTAEPEAVNLQQETKAPAPASTVPVENEQDDSQDETDVVIVVPSLAIQADIPARPEATSEPVPALPVDVGAEQQSEPETETAPEEAASPPALADVVGTKSADRPPASFAARLNRQTAVVKQEPAPAPAPVPEQTPIDLTGNVDVDTPAPVPLPEPTTGTSVAQTVEIPAEPVSDGDASSAVTHAAETPDENQRVASQSVVQDAVVQSDENVPASVPVVEQSEVETVTAEQPDETVQPKPELQAERPADSRPRGLKFRGEQARETKQPSNAQKSDTTATTKAAVATGEPDPVPGPVAAEKLPETFTTDDTVNITRQQGDTSSNESPSPGTAGIHNERAQQSQPQGTVSGISIGLPSGPQQVPAQILPSQAESVTVPTKPSEAVAPAGTETPVSVAPNHAADTSVVSDFARESFTTTRTQQTTSVGSAPASVPAEASAKVEQQPLLSQIQSSLLESNAVPRQVRVQLQPSELGNLRLDVTQEGTRLTARIETDTASTHKMLVEHLPQLKESLSQQGLQLDRLDLSFAPQRDGQQTSQQFQQQQHDEQQSPKPELPNNRRFTRENPLTGSSPGTSRKLDRLDVTI